MIEAPTLEAFKRAGFLFDHAVRCPLSTAEITRERVRAQRYHSERAAQAKPHLAPLISMFPSVWAMGHIARNAVVEACALHRTLRRLDSPYVAPEATKFFFSQYFRPRFDKPQDVTQVISVFKTFLQAQASSQRDGATSEINRLLAERRGDILTLAARHGAHNVRVFGSVARGEAHQASDIDFLVDMEPGRSLLDLGGLLVELRAFLAQELIQDAVIRNFQIIGEAAKRVPEDDRRIHDGIPWRSLAAFRDVLIHQDHGLEREIAGETSDEPGGSTS